MATNVLQLLEKINRAAQRMNNPGISKLEYDLLMQHVRDLYDALDTMRQAPVSNVARPEVKAVEQPVVRQQAEPVVVVQQTPTIEEKPVAENAVQEIIEHIQPVEHVKPIVMKQEPVQQPKQEPIVERREELSVEVRHEPAVVLRDEPLMVAHTPITDKVEQAVPINERIKSSGDLNERWKGTANEVHHKYAVKPLKDMIDLNRRIAFVSELFKGNGEELGKAVQTIDSYTDYDTAKIYVNSLARTWNWYESSQTAKLFVKLVKQRFGEE